MILLFKGLVIAWYSIVLSFENARSQRTFADDEHREMRAERMRFFVWEPGADRQKTRLIFRVENARPQRAFPLVSLPYFNCFVMLVYP